eukprot:1157872-Pelagomonas_calceolata.AAC.10
MVRSTCGEGAAQLLTAEQCAVQCASCCYGVVEGVSGEGKSTYCDGWWDFTLCTDATKMRCADPCGARLWQRCRRVACVGQECCLGYKVYKDKAFSQEVRLLACS